MPIYDVLCPHCGNRDTMFRHVDERDDTPECCGASMERVISAPMIRPDIQPYQSPIDGRTINSRKQRMEDLKRSGCRPWEGIEVEKREAAKARAADEAAFDRKLEEGAAHVLSHMSAEKQAILKQS